MSVRYGHCAAQAVFIRAVGQVYGDGRSAAGQVEHAKSRALRAVIVADGRARSKKN